MLDTTRSIYCYISFFCGFHFPFLSFYISIAIMHISFL